MAEPKDIVDFEALTPAVGDYLIVQRSASVGGKATVQAVVDAGIAAAVGVWPYVLASDTTTYSGSGTDSTKPVVASVVIPADTLITNGGSLRLQIMAFGMNGANNLSAQFGSETPFLSNNAANLDESIDVDIVRKSATLASVTHPTIPEPDKSVTWANANTINIRAAADVTVRLVRVIVYPG